MKPFAIFAVVALMGCNPNDSTAPSAEVPADPPAVEEPGTPAEAPAAEAPEAGNCALELEIVCTEGFVDGCPDGRTLSHACVPVDDHETTPCAQEIARVCADGLVDGCLTTPPLTRTHVCVSQ